MYEYDLELFFYKNKNQKGIHQIPNLDEYDTKTKMIKICTWEDYRNAVLSNHPNVAYILVHTKKLLTEIDVYCKKFETKDFEIKQSKIHGMGVFAKRNISKNEKILELTGDFVKASNYKDSYPEGEWNIIGDNFLLRKERTLYSFINHSLSPNAEIKMNELVVNTSKDIEKDEEITINYTKERLPDSYLRGHGATYLFR